MGKILRSVTLAGLLAMLLPAGSAWADDVADIRTAISSQLQAFRKGDGEAAYSFAAPNIKALFPTPDVFMSMVETGYGPVFRSSNAVFGELTPFGDGFRQDVFLTDPKGQSWIASYTLERQPDGSMQITGCALRKSDDLAA